MQHESLTLSVAPPSREMLSLHANISIEQISQIRQESKVDHDFSVFWVPRRTLVSDRILEENGVLGEVTIGECPLFLIPLEPDLLSLELEDAFSDLYLVCPASVHIYPRCTDLKTAQRSYIDLSYCHSTDALTTIHWSLPSHPRQRRQRKETCRSAYSYAFRRGSQRIFRHL